jgi:hypothetical protein
MKAPEELPLSPELAELAIVLRDERITPDDAVGDRLDARVARAVQAREARRGRPDWRALCPVAGVLVAALAVAVVVVVSGGSSRPTSPRELANGLPPETPHAASSSHAASGAAVSRSAAGTAATTAAPGPVGPGSGNIAGALPLPNGRKQVDSAQLQLTTPAGQIEAVAQQAFAAIAAENGIVEHSTVSAGGAGNAYAEIAVSVPEGELGATMARLSQLRGARVASRTDATQDVTGAAGADNRRLADDRALRSSLLRRLAQAVTQEQIDAVNAQIHDSEGAISRDERAIAALNRRVARSEIELTIDGGGVIVAPGTPSSGGGGFTLHRAVHDAGRVLVVGAGVALIALAALVPLTLVLGLVAWLVALLRRRGRERALDAA